MLCCKNCSCLMRSTSIVVSLSCLGYLFYCKVLTFKQWYSHFVCSFTKHVWGVSNLSLTLLWSCLCTLLWCYLWISWFFIYLFNRLGNFTNFGLLKKRYCKCHIVPRWAPMWIIWVLCLLPQIGFPRFSEENCDLPYQKLQTGPVRPSL